MYQMANPVNECGLHPRAQVVGKASLVLKLVPILTALNNGIIRYHAGIFFGLCWEDPPPRSPPQFLS